MRIGVVGLSVGHVIAHTLAAQGMCGELRLADFDRIELSNLNRVPATVLDLGCNKAEVAARRIAELDPYLQVQVLDMGLTLDTVDEFLNGLDIVVEECDSLHIKAIVRQRARARRIPVLMATSDRGLVDVERFDLQPKRPILHGLLGNVDTAVLSGMTSREKVPHKLRFLEAEELSSRGAASLVEIDHTLSTWPQVSGDAVMGATAIAEAVRRIGLGEELRSGRVRLDVGGLLDHLDEPEMPTDGPRRWRSVLILRCRAFRASSPLPLFVRRPVATRSPGISKPVPMSSPSSLRPNTRRCLTSVGAAARSRSERPSSMQKSPLPVNECWGR